MQAMAAPGTHSPPSLAQTTIPRLLPSGEGRHRTGDSLGITAPEHRLKMRPDNMMVGLTTDNLCNKESTVTKKHKANREVIIREIGHVADTRYDDNYKVKLQ